MREPILKALQDGKLFECLDGEVATLLGLIRSDVRALSVASSGPGTGVWPPPKEQLRGGEGWIKYGMYVPERSPMEAFHSYSTLGGSPGHCVVPTDRQSAVVTYQIGLKNAFREWISKLSKTS